MFSSTLFRVLALCTTLLPTSILANAPQPQPQPHQQQTPAPTNKDATLAAIGFGVSNLTYSTQWYIKNLNLTDTGQRFSAPQFNEVVLAMPGVATGSRLALMEYKPKRNVTNLPVKLVFLVEDIKRQVEVLRAAGARIVIEPGSAKLGNVSIPTAFAMDPDGYLLEINSLDLKGL